MALLAAAKTGDKAADGDGQWRTSASACGGCHDAYPRQVTAGLSAA